MTSYRESLIIAMLRILIADIETYDDQSLVRDTPLKEHTRLTKSYLKWVLLRWL